MLNAETLTTGFGSVSSLTLRLSPMSVSFSSAGQIWYRASSQKTEGGMESADAGRDAVSRTKRTARAVAPIVETFFSRVLLHRVVDQAGDPRLS